MLVAFGVAQLAAGLVRSSLPAGREHVLVPHVLSLVVLHNTGVAFGLLAGLGPMPVVALGAVVLGVLLYHYSAWARSGAGQWGVGLMLGGALANIVERVRFGYVLDYLDIHVWPVFNLADTAVVVGAGLLLLALSRLNRARS
jgi:signal peptidase II